jgi:hypothetical protein
MLARKNPPPPPITIPPVITHDTFDLRMASKELDKLLAEKNTKAILALLQHEQVTPRSITKAQIISILEFVADKWEDVNMFDILGVPPMEDAEPAVLRILIKLLETKFAHPDIKVRETIRAKRKEFYSSGHEDTPKTKKNGRRLVLCFTFISFARRKKI